MKLSSPLDIDLLEFIRTGKFDYIKIGQTKEWISNNFPDPDLMYKDNYESPIWFYGNIEFHFHEDETLFLIYSDYIETLTGGDNLKLNKWIFNEPDKLTIENVTHHLTKQRIAFKLEFGSLSSGYTSAAIRILTSHVKLSFALEENDEDDIEVYHKKTLTEDANQFKLFSFSLSND
jgi:hypothetical protein